MMHNLLDHVRIMTLVLAATQLIEQSIDRLD